MAKDYPFVLDPFQQVSIACLVRQRCLLRHETPSAVAILACPGCGLRGPACGKWVGQL